MGANKEYGYLIGFFNQFRDFHLTNMTRNVLLLPVLLFFPLLIWAQEKLQWKNADSLFGPLPGSIHVFYTDREVDNKPFRAYYVIADIKNRKLDFTTDTTLNRRLTPQQFFEKNNKPVVVVNGTFFSFQTHQNLNTVIRNGELVGYNIHTLPGRGKDTLTYRHPFGSAIGISKKRKADVAWLLTDSTSSKAMASQNSIPFIKDSISRPEKKYLLQKSSTPRHKGFEKWKMKTAIGGGPVLVQNGEVSITNNEEIKFGGKAINDKHPRTAMGYTADNKLIILVIEGRNPEAAGASLLQEAQILKDLGCIEALNLDGGGSSCLLVNGRETIKPSDKVQRAVPGVFLIIDNRQ